MIADLCQRVDILQAQPQTASADAARLQYQATGSTNVDSMQQKLVLLDAEVRAKRSEVEELRAKVRHLLVAYIVFIAQIPLVASRHDTTRSLAHAFWHRKKS